MTENEKYFNQYPNADLFLKVDSNYFLEENAMAAKIYSAQMGSPIEIIKREDLVKLAESNEIDSVLNEVELVDKKEAGQTAKRKNNKKH